MKRCRWCSEPIEFIEPGEACGWAHRDFGSGVVLRFWCGQDEDGRARRVEPRTKARAGIK